MWISRTARTDARDRLPVPGIETQLHFMQLNSSFLTRAFRKISQYLLGIPQKFLAFHSTSHLYQYLYNSQWRLTTERGKGGDELGPALALRRLEDMAKSNDFLMDGAARGPHDLHAAIRALGRARGHAVHAIILHGLRGDAADGLITEERQQIDIEPEVAHCQ